MLKTENVGEVEVVVGKPGKGVLYRVSDAANVVGCSTASLRRWEAEGLIRPMRTPAGYRVFDEVELGRLRRIAYMRTVRKMNVAAIRQLLSDPRPENRKESKPKAVLGRHLRRLRTKKQITLQQAADGIGVSVSHLSALERDLTGASVSTVKRVLAYYGTTLNDLLDPKSTRSHARLTRSGKRPLLAEGWSGVTIERLALGQPVMEVQIHRVDPGSGSEGAYSHEGEEFIYVLEGTLQIELGDTEVYRIKPGDCLYFPSTLPHAWRNPGDATAVLLWVNTPPTF